MADELGGFGQEAGGGSDMIQLPCSDLQINEYVMIQNRPCKIVEMSTSAISQCLDIFTQQRYESICPSTHKMDVPIVTRKDYELLDSMPDGYLSLMDPETGETRDDLKKPEGELGEEIDGAISDGKQLIVTVLTAVGEEKVIATSISQVG